MHTIWDAGEQLSILNNSITPATLSRGNDISVRIGKSNIIKFGVGYGFVKEDGEQFDRVQPRGDLMKW
jgi:hypothetical protein